MIGLRRMSAEDVGLLVAWDEDPDVRAALGGRGAEWYEWSTELARDVPWRELLIAVDDRRPVGFVQLTDAAEEESHYWGDVDPGTWAIDIWIGSARDRGRGTGTQVMRQAVDRVFARHGATSILIDPKATNQRAIAFYERLGFQPVAERDFGDNVCVVMRLDRPGPKDSDAPG